MMITYTTGNIFDSDCQALVNPVNCVGAMGKGLAKGFKERFPKNYKIYKMSCVHGEVKVGKILVTLLEKNKFIFNFPTKLHWRQDSKFEYITLGLDNLVKVVIPLFKIKSIAIPALGCGLGGLNWPEVKSLIDKKLDRLDNIKVVVYEPR